MKMAFVTPRYGTEVMGGAETAARQLAEHLVADCGAQVEIFTSCALDHITWAEHFGPGVSELNGVTVRRFASTSGRQPEFYELDAKVRVAPSEAGWAMSQRWVDLNGPVSPGLIEALCDSDVEAAAFYPYLYYPTVRAITKVPMPALLHPAAHDEPSLYLPVFASTFGSADAFCYHTMAERRLVQRHYRVAEVPQIVLGLGVGEAVGTGRPGAELAGIGDRPYIVSLGRVDSHKGSVMLAEFFRRYKVEHPGPLTLVLVGPVSADIEHDDDVVLTGVVDEADKWDLLAGAQFTISPSALESFSLVVLESWVAGAAVVVNANCDPTREHCERSGGGLWFDSYPSFAAIVELLSTNEAIRNTLAERGRRYVEEFYAWPALIDRYRSFVEGVIDRGRRAFGVY